MRILHLEPDLYSKDSLKILGNLGELTLVNKDVKQIELEEILKLHEFEVIFTRLGLSVNDKIINNQSGNLKYIVTPTTGLNHIDVSAADIQGIHIISLRGDYDFLSQIQSTAEHTWALLLNISRH